MKYFLVLMFSLMMGSLFAQENDSIINFSAEMDLGEVFSFENKSIQFKKVITDSRCPKDVTCIWAGEAKVLIAVMENGREVEEKIITLAVKKDFQLSFLNSEVIYSINALNLYPYPTSTHKIKESEYCLIIQLNKKLE